MESSALKRSKSKRKGVDQNLQPQKKKRFDSTDSLRRKPSSTLCLTELTCVSANIHQGNDSFDEFSRGRQCVTNAAMSIIFKNTIKTNISEWTSVDLDLLLFEGDKLYKHVRKVCRHPYLHPSDLPDGICLQGKRCKFVVAETYSGNIGSNFENQLPFYSLESALNCCLSDISSSGILVCNEMGVAVFYSGSTFFVFDPHSCDSKANPCSDGTAVLCSVNTFNEFLVLLRKLFQVDGDLPFDLHKIKTKLLARKSFLQMNDTYTCSNDSIHSEKAITSFHKCVDSGPSYVCKSCNQIWFKHSVKKATGVPVSFLKKLSLEVENIICMTCYSYLKVMKIPPCSLFNGLQFPVTPPELKITSLEERLIAPRVPFMQLHEKPRGGQLSITGNVVDVPADVTSTVTKLPRVASEYETIHN